MSPWTNVSMEQCLGGKLPMGKICTLYSLQVHVQLFNVGLTVVKIRNNVIN